jgi:serine/threonine protein kinase
MHGLTPSIVHGDIKGVRSKFLVEACNSSFRLFSPQTNVLVNDAGEACLSDIGAGKMSFPSDWTFGTSSIRWMAPELMISHESNEDDHVTCQTDVYSFSMTVIEVCPTRIFSHSLITFTVPDLYWLFTVLISTTSFDGDARCNPRSASQATFESRSYRSNVGFDTKLLAS